MEPWKSWAIVGVVGASAAYYYSQSGKAKRGRDLNPLLQADKIQGHTSDSKNDGKDARKKKKKGLGKASNGSDRAAIDASELTSSRSTPGSTDKVKRHKAAKNQSSKLPQTTAIDLGNEPEVDSNITVEENEELSNREFAEQLSGLKTGTSLKKPDRSDRQNKKTRKQGKSKEILTDVSNGSVAKPNGIAAGPDMSTASSTTGADADDDLSMPVSPELGASQITTPSGGDVSDMLEVPTKAPSVLRVTQPSTLQPARQEKATKITPEPETKKQRQNRQKKEEKKALREQAEKDRRVLLEKQLRTSREAEGRPAKNGLGTSKPPSTSAWINSTENTASPAASQTTEPTKSDGGPLLDTFDDDKSFLGQTKPHVNGEADSQATANNKGLNGDILSEEEQIRLISEMDSDDTWNTVAKGKGKKKAASVKPADSAKETTSSGSSIKNSNNRSFDHTNTAASTTSKSSSRADSVVTIETERSGPPVNLDNTASGANGEKISNGIDGMNENGISSSFADTSLSTELKKADTAGEPVNPTKGLHMKQAGGGPPYKNPYYTGVPSHVSKHWRAVAKHLDRDIWNYDNISNHPEFNAMWPYALTGHPCESDWAADWDSDDLKRGNERRAKKEAEEKVERKSGKEKTLESQDL